jgi:hypothetical protein
MQTILYKESCSKLLAKARAVSDVSLVTQSSAGLAVVHTHTHTHTHHTTPHHTTPNTHTHTHHTHHHTHTHTTSFLPWLDNIHV